MNSYLKQIESSFKNNSNRAIAGGQENYMKNHFLFFGIKTEKRRSLQILFLTKDKLPDKKDLEQVIKHLWNKPHREFQYFAQELLLKYSKQIEQEDIRIFEYMVLHKSWWDTVDLIASKLMGNYFIKFPDERNKIISKWLHSDNIWLQRSALLFQLKYKSRLDTTLLKSVIKYLHNSNEFFIKKAIGWILREYSKTNPEWVIAFVNTTPLSSLSRKEALKVLAKNGFTNR